MIPAGVYFCNAIECVPCSKCEPTHPEPAPKLGPCACGARASHTRGGEPRCDDCGEKEHRPSIADSGGPAAIGEFYRNREKKP